MQPLPHTPLPTRRRVGKVRRKLCKMGVLFRSYLVPHVLISSPMICLHQHLPGIILMILAARRLAHMLITHSFLSFINGYQGINLSVSEPLKTSSFGG